MIPTSLIAQEDLNVFINQHSRKELFTIVLDNILKSTTSLREVNPILHLMMRETTSSGDPKIISPKASEEK